MRAAGFVVVFLVGVGTGWLLRDLPTPGLMWAAFEARNRPPWNWCPMSVTRVTVLGTGREITESEGLKRICAARIDRIVEAPEGKKFVAIYKAVNAQNETTFLETDEEHRLFRADGRVFESLGMRADP